MARRNGQEADVNLREGLDTGNVWGIRCTVRRVNQRLRKFAVNVRTEIASNINTGGP